MRSNLNRLLQQVVKIHTTYLNPLSSAVGIFYFREFLIIVLLFFSIRSFSQPILKISEPRHNFGTVQRGELLSCDFEITNSGTMPLIIQNAEVSCSCTEVEFSKQPLLPGQKSVVRVLFNTKTVYGRQDRVVILQSNAKNSPNKLRYKANVTEK